MLLTIPEKQVDDLIENTSKWIDQTMEWENRGRSGFLLGPITVHSSEPYDLVFIVSVNKANMAMMLHSGRKGGQVLRRWDTNLGHTNPDEKTALGVPHKHRWTDKDGDLFAYVPNPQIDQTDVSNAMRDFLVECKIDLKVELPPCIAPDSYHSKLTQKILLPSLDHLTYEGEEENDDQELQ